MSVLANLIARDLRSVTGRNLNLINEMSRCNVWSDSPAKVKAALLETEIVDIADEDKWRVIYLNKLLNQRQEWHYLGEEHEKEQVQKLIDSLCVN